MSTVQLFLPFSPVRNRGLFSSHWLENRLPLEPEWDELRAEARDVLERMADVWRVQGPRVGHYGSEQQLEQGFIQPVLDLLGWRILYQTYLEGWRPDYALFADDASLEAALHAGHQSPDFWRLPNLVADAKNWHVRLDRPTVVNNRKEYPPQQIERYLERSRLDFGLLTNGGLWRLIPRLHGPHQRRFQTYLECDLPAILNAWIAAPNLAEQSTLLDAFLTFYLFFSPVAFREVDGRRPLVVRAMEGSSEYRIGVGQGLKEQAFDALRLCVEGFLNFQANSLDADDDLETCREQSFILLYRLLFVMYAEDRQLLPYRTNATYTRNRSLGRLRDEIAARLDRIRFTPVEDFSRESTDIWADLLSLFDLVDRGHRTYGVPAYNGGLFDPEAHPFLAEHQISDWYVARVIDQLGRAPDPEHPTRGLFRVDYHDLAIQHLGSVYEGLLELRPHHAAERMVVIAGRGKKRDEQVIPASTRVPQGYAPTGEIYEAGSVYLLTHKGERRATGSYYTPDEIVDYIIENTLGPLCRAISEQLEREIRETESLLNEEDRGGRAELAEKLERLYSDYDDRILSLRVLDPSAGSGHFLLRACQFLAEEIATHPYTRADTGDTGAAEEPSLMFWKRQVVERCLYGVDMNAMAVELAKLALWLETVAADRPLSFLDHHIRHGNTLIGARVSALGVLPGEIEMIARDFARQVEDQIHVLLPTLAAIRRSPSESTEQVKDKQRLYRDFDRARRPFLRVADLWCSLVGDERGELTAERYQSALELVTHPNRFRRLGEEPWFQAATSFARRQDVACFHWELEFPEVFFDEQGRRLDAGFDAVIGNPPYDVLSEAETGKDLSTLRAFITQDSVYEPSRRGKNNLYKLFICRALDLLVGGGRLGFITPMAVLGDDQAADVRRLMAEVGSFTGVEAFPQKDNPENRVFREAKLSTAVFTLVKELDSEGLARPFRARVHPGRRIEEGSPSLTLTTEQIPLYDPENFTIVSCSQEDWDLATRIMSTGRLTRLKQFAEFFQGEVNETNERARGNLVDDPERGQLVTRGASICLYILRSASQGTDLFLNVHRFLSGKGEDSKAFHHRWQRVGLQESSPQNNFRRIIAALVPEGEFCNHTVNYSPAHKCLFDLRYLVALLNSRLSEWYFRLGSTNAHVSHYQLYNLPCPVFREESRAPDLRLRDETFRHLDAGDFEGALITLATGAAAPPFSPAIRDSIIEAVSHIIDLEIRRGDITRQARSALAPEAQPFQDFIDQLFYMMAGLTDLEVEGLEQRLEGML